MKENYQKFKVLMKNPKYKALSKLLLWFIYFGIIYLVVATGIGGKKFNSSVNNNKNKNDITTDTLENYQNMNSFEYTYKINYEDKEVVINGTFFNGNYYFMIDNDSYYFSDSLYFVLKDTKQLLIDPKIDLPINITELDRLVIYNWMDNSYKDSEVTYNDKSKKIEYIYSMEDSYKIYIEVFEKDYLIENININLIDFLLTKDLQFENFNVYIEYKNINNISSYERNYDEYEIIHESV